MADFSKLLDETFSHGILAGSIIADEIRQHVLALVDPDMSTEEFLRAARDIVAAHEPLLARTLSDAALAGWLLGGVEAVTDLQLPRAETPPLPPPYHPANPVVILSALEEAANELRSWQILTPTEYAQAGRDARAAGFTVARLGTAEAIEKVRQAAYDNLVAGGDWRDFRDRVETVLGEGILSKRHMETIWRTAFSRAVTSGQERTLRQPLVEDEFPFRATIPIRDSRLTELCRVVSVSGLNGTNVFWCDDPVWREYAPPRHLR